MTGDDGRILDQIRGFFGDAPPNRLGVAVSGGGDSVALLHILNRCFLPGAVAVAAATVDHGLRPEAAEEARAVGDLAQRLGISHTILRWTGWDGSGNLQDQARRARYGLLTGWARENGITHLALAHTADDQAETLLMRLGRAAGVDGLSGMPARRVQDGVTLVRPALGLSRDDLRAYLRLHGVAWAEDPSNDNTDFDRIKARRALEVLAPLGIDAAVLGEVAGNMARARAALDHATGQAVQECVTFDAGDVLIDRDRFAALPEEIARRLVLLVLRWIGGGDYPPRRDPLAATIEATRTGTTLTLAGCLIAPQDGRTRICREFAAVRDLVAPPGAPWDRRWLLDGPRSERCQIRALGWDGLAECPFWRSTGRPRASLAATPSVWRDGRMIAAPLAGLPEGWSVRLVETGQDFLASSLSH